MTSFEPFRTYVNGKSHGLDPDPRRNFHVIESVHAMGHGFEGGSAAHDVYPDMLTALRAQLAWLGQPARDGGDDSADPADSDEDADEDVDDDADEDAGEGAYEDADEGAYEDADEDGRGFAGEEDLGAWRQSIEGTIAEILNRGSDEGVRPHYLSVEGQHEAYFTIAAGYWEQFVPQALAALEGDLHDRLECLSEEADDWDAEQDGADDGPDGDPLQPQGGSGMSGRGASDEAAELAQELGQVRRLMQAADPWAESLVDELLFLLSAYEARQA
jgi:hypothetical protein